MYTYKRAQDILCSVFIVRGEKWIGRNTIGF